MIFNKVRWVATAAIWSLLCGCATSVTSTFKIKPYEEYTLDNGLEVILIKDETLPAVSMTMLVKSGSSQDPSDKAGIGHMTSELLDKGTTRRSASKIAEELAAMGAEFSASTDNDYSMFTARSLSDYETALIELFAEIVTQPSFPNPEIAREKKQLLSVIQKLVDEPRGFTNLAHEHFLYGGHPYGQPAFGTRKSVQEIRKKDLVKHYLQNFRPNNSILAITGDFDAKAIRQKIAFSFGNWQSRELKSIALEQATPLSGTHILVVDKKGLNQAQIRFGHLGITRKDPDFLNLRIASTVLGGAFHSRLMDEVRVKRGLTYGITSQFDPRLGQGPFLISTFTRNDKVGDTVGTTLKTLKEFIANGITEDELASAKQLLKGQFPRSLETSEALAGNMLILKYYGISYDYLQNYFSMVDALTVSSVNQAIKKHFSADNILITLYTDSSETLQQLKPFGEVELKRNSDFF